MKCDYSELRGKKLLVAGGTGFIGKRAVEIFASLGLKVYVISRGTHENKDNVTYYQADLNDMDSLLKFSEDEFDYLVYMAANIPLRGSKKEDYFDAKKSTLDPFINFCNAFLKKCKKFVYVSSVDVLGGCATYEYDENAEVRNATPYGLAKYVGEFYTKNVCNSYGIPYGILRFAQVYGPNEPIVRIIPIIKKSLFDEAKFTLVTTGEERRRFLYIDDAVKSIVHALIFANNDIYNIAGPDVVSMNQLISKMETTFNKTLNLEVKGEIVGEDNIPSIKKAQGELQYEPDVNIDEGLRLIREAENA